MLVPPALLTFPLLALPSPNLPTYKPCNVVYTLHVPDFPLRITLQIPSRARSTLLNLLILLSGDVSPNPGPRAPKYPCGVCCKAVNWGQDAVKCDECDAWYHVPCMNMNPSFYHILQTHSNITWLCCQRGMPSFSSFLFNTTPIDLSNSFSVLSIGSRLTSNTCISSPPRPLHASTPNATHRSPNRTTLFSNATLDLSNFSSHVNSNTITKDLHTSPHPARISTLNSIPSSRTAQLSDIPPTDLTESLSSTDSLTECTYSSFTHTPHPTNQTDTGSPTNSTSFIRPFRIVTINFQSCRNKTQELEHLINSVKPDVIIGTETWLNSTINSNEIIKSALGFNVYRKDRPNK